MKTFWTLQQSAYVIILLICTEQIKLVNSPLKGNIFLPSLELVLLI